MHKNKVANLIPVLVTGVGGGGHGHEIVKALRLAGRYRLVGVDMNEASVGFVDVDEAYVIPPATDPDYIEILLEICKRKQIKVVFHGSEPELKVISQQRHQFASMGVLVPINTPQVIELGMDKWQTMSFLKGCGFPIPTTKRIMSEEEISLDFPLPAVVKPFIGGGGSNNTFLVQDADEVLFACRFLLRQGLGVLVQEYIGTPDDEYTVGVLCTLDGELISSIALRRYILSGLSNRIKVPNRSTRKELTPVLAVSSGISQGVIDDFPDVRRACEAIAAAIQSRGPLNIQCRFVNGTLYPFEINPRFSGTTYIRALMGLNEPDLMIRHHLLGEVIPKPVQYQFGRVLRGLREEVISQAAGNVGAHWNPHPQNEST
jgi:carbamoyl-phosphate synthase large subunit